MALPPHPLPPLFNVAASSGETFSLSFPCARNIEEWGAGAGGKRTINPYRFFMSLHMRLVAKFLPPTVPMDRSWGYTWKVINAQKRRGALRIWIGLRFPQNLRCIRLVYACLSYACLWRRDLSERIMQNYTHALSLRIRPAVTLSLRIRLAVKQSYTHALSLRIRPAVKNLLSARALPNRNR